MNPFNPFDPGTPEYDAWEAQGGLDDKQDKPETLMPPPGAPMAVARKLEHHHRESDQLTLRHWRGNWIRWDRLAWVEDEGRAVRAWLYEQLEHTLYLNDEGIRKPWNPTRKKVGDVLDALSGTMLLPETVDAPAWLSRRGDDPPADQVVACANGLLHVATRKLYELTPRYFNLVSVPFAYDPAAAEPTEWLTFLGLLWPGDPAAIAALQEYFGYVLSGRTDLQKILLLTGPPRSGKGTIARILAALVGKGNAAGPTLASLATNFGLEPLLGKPLAVISDARLGHDGVYQVVERLLSISGEDMLTVDRKYRTPWTGKLPTRFVILSNEVPHLGDASGAIASRFIVLQQTISWLGREDPALTGKLLTELPGILRWSLDGLDRLTNVGRFTMPASADAAIAMLQDLTSPMSVFVRDECSIGPACSVPVQDLFVAWKTWCEDNGRDRPGTVQSFGRNLLAVAPAVRLARPRDGGSRIRTYEGIALSAADNGMGRGPSRTTGYSEQPVRDRTTSRQADEQGEHGVVRSGPRPAPLSAALDTADRTCCGSYPPGVAGGPLVPACKLCSTSPTFHKRAAA